MLEERSNVTYVIKIRGYKFVCFLRLVLLHICLQDFPLECTESLEEGI